MLFIFYPSASLLAFFEWIEEMDINRLIDPVTYNNITQNFHRFNERLESVVKVVCEFYVVKGLQEGILSEVAQGYNWVL